MPLRLEVVDLENPNNIAFLRGPLALFAVGKIPDRIISRDRSFVTI